MANYYWIKLYHEILHDAKMARLPDVLWRRVVECFLLAGEAGEDGFLPDVPTMAWVLRVDEEQLITELGQLSSYDFVEQQDGRWYVTHFFERQKAFTDAEKQRNYRDRQRKEQYYGDDTDMIPSDNHTVTESVTSGNTDIELDIDKSREESPSKKQAKKKADPPPPSVQVFHANTQRYPSKSLYPDIHTAIGDKPDDLAFWGDVVKNWLLMGWNKTNLKGMLDFYKRREIPPGNGKNGKEPPPAAQDYSAMQPVHVPTVFEEESCQEKT